MGTQFPGRSQISETTAVSLLYYCIMHYYLHILCLVYYDIEYAGNHTPCVECNYVW